MKATILKTAIALAAVMTTVPAMAQNAALAVTVNGQPVAFPGQGPVENGGRVLVPLRGVLEKLGAYVTYDSSLQQVKAVRDEMHITLPIGSRTAQVGDRSVTLDTPARILNGSTMVPLRFVAESLGAHVDYEPATSTVAIHTRAGDRDDRMRPPRAGDGNDQMRPPMPMSADPRLLVRGTVVAVHPHEKSLVIQQGDGTSRDINLTPDYRARRRTPDGDVTIDLDRIQPGDRVALEMRGGIARTVTVLPDHSDMGR
jgi:hypothetical protein